MSDASPTMADLNARLQREREWADTLAGIRAPRRHHKPSERDTAAALLRESGLLAKYPPAVRAALGEPVGDTRTAEERDWDATIGADLDAIHQERMERIRALAAALERRPS
jgi:hypothetical protein